MALCIRGIFASVLFFLFFERRSCEETQLDCEETRASLIADDEFQGMSRMTRGTQMYM